MRSGPGRDLTRQAWRFGLVGVAATLLHLALALLLIEAGGLAPLAANFLAFCAALGLSYLGNHAWTFAMQGGHGSHLPRFLAVALAGLALNQGILALAIGPLGLGHRLGLALAVTLVPLLTFLANRAWAFRRRDCPARPVERSQAP